MTIIKYITKARPAPKNEIWEQEIDGQTFICERPQYKNSHLEVEWFTTCFKEEAIMVFGKELPFFFDEEGRWWVHPQLCSKEMLQYFIAHPTKYVSTMSRKVQDVNTIIATLREIEPSLGTKDPQQLRKHFEQLYDSIVKFYSYYFITYILFDEMVLRFQEILQSFLEEKDANVYMTEFLRAEITKEAIRHGAIGETTEQRRDVFYSDVQPIIFYKEPKFLMASEYDNEVIAKLFASQPSAEHIQEFFALRLMVPLGFQINEEAQYVESKMLFPMMKMTLENIQKVLMGQEVLQVQDDIRQLSREKIIYHLQQVGKEYKEGSKITDEEESPMKKTFLKGLGASPGQAEGKVQLFLPGTDNTTFQEGDILVTTITDPTMVQAMVKAAAIITDIGGITSHPAILSRELGIPCIVNTKTATKELKTGMRIRIDGEKGEIHVLD